VTIVLLPLVAIGALVAWAAGMRPRLIAWGALVACLLLLVASIALFGAFAFLDDDSDGTSNPTEQQAVRRPDERITDVEVGDDAFAAPVGAIDDLTDGEVRLIEIDGLPAADGALARQCQPGDGRCGLAVPIQADDDGRARFLFEFAERLRADPTDCTREPCTLVVHDADGDQVAAVPLVFGATVDGGVLSVERPRAVATGESVAVSLTGFRPGPVTVALCAPPGPADAESCGAPGPEVVATISASGAATVELPVAEGAVGSRGARCARGLPCAVAVLGRPDIAVVEIGFAGSADARPGTTQVIVGLSIAALLLAAAAIAIRRGPWTPPGGDPFAGIEIDDPFADLDDLPDDADADVAQPATSRRVNANVPAATSVPT
jgi:hypothetical protein